ncbi:hypothetical protein [Mangrovicoccus sp. HB161399]|uniref:hypothetical protein n=1 Tax=Mangrovicoccus sp. HB161399 TaxID=2720392 RepID=UPI001551B5B1|nr:hypothetical protein [Mangrovicoccus sp. HB161399]
MTGHVHLLELESGADPAPSHVRAALRRILDSSDFLASEHRRDFLSFIVEESLSGRAERLKGYTIATEVYGRDESFDAQADPVVRLEARRLRRDLDGYYAGSGQADPLRISMPKGGYQPQFGWSESAMAAAVPAAPDPAPVPDPAPEDAAAPAGRRLPDWRRYAMPAAAGLACLALALLAGGLLLRSSPAPAPRAALEGPAVAVLPFDVIGSGEEVRSLADGLRQELTVDLMRFPGFRLFTVPGNGMDGLGADPLDSVRAAEIGYVVSGSARLAPDRATVIVQLLDARSGLLRWSQIYHRDLASGGIADLQQDLAAEIAGALGQPYGAVPEDLRRRSTEPGMADLAGYLCVLRAYDYRRNFSKAKFAPAFGCLEETVGRQPGYADAWAMLGWLRLDAVRFGYGSGTPEEDRVAGAYEAGAEAVRLDPDSLLALKSLSAIQYYRGNYAASERLGWQALRLNPNDPDTQAQLGWRLAARGNFADGIPLLESAVALSSGAPPWYFYFLAIDRYLKGSNAEMLDFAERSTSDGLGAGYMLVAIAQGAIGQAPETRTALARMEDHALIGADPEPFLRDMGLTEELVAALVGGIGTARNLVAGP